MAKHETTLEWTTIDPASLSKGQQDKYAAYKEGYRLMKAARVAFEEAMQEDVPQGQRIVCGYNFGKLSVAMTADDRKPVAKAKAVGCLADFIAESLASGRRA